MPSFIAGPRLARGELVALLKPFEVAPGGVYAVYPPGRHLAGKVRALVDFLGEKIPRRPELGSGLVRSD